MGLKVGPGGAILVAGGNIAVGPGTGCCCAYDCDQCCGNRLSVPPVQGMVQGLWGQWNDLPNGDVEDLGGGCYRQCKYGALNGQLFTLTEDCFPTWTGCGAFDLSLAGESFSCETGHVCNDTPGGIEVFKYWCEPQFEGDPGVECTWRVTRVVGQISCYGMTMHFQGCSYCTYDGGTTWGEAGPESNIALCGLGASVESGTVCDAVNHVLSADGDCNVNSSFGICWDSGPFHGTMGAVL